MFTCSECSEVFQNETRLQVHMRDQHPLSKPYTCPTCKKPFKMKGSMTRHTATCGGSVDMVERAVTETTPPSTTPPSTTPPSTTPPPTTFAQWRARYNVDRKPGEPEFTEDAGQHAVQFMGRLQRESPLPVENALELEEFLDQYIDQHQSTLRPSTVSTHLRYMRWYALWKTTTGDCPQASIDVLDASVETHQSFASRHDHHMNLMNYLSPGELIDVRERLVTALRSEQQGFVDPFVTRMIKFQNISGSELQLHAKRLRNWIEVALRVVDVPMRIQCSKYMKLPSGDTAEYDFVCRLEKLPGGYARLVCRDKVQKSHQPVRIPLPRVLNPYLHAYLTLCRDAIVPHGSPYVFTNGAGGVWTDASKDVKTYIRQHLGIDTEEIEPSGRFVHCTRKMALASFSTKVRFDMGAVRNFAKLMRHSVATSEQYYCQWSETSLAQEGVRQWSSAMLGTPVVQEDIDPYTPGSLRVPPDFIDGWFRDTFVFVRPCSDYNRADATTQTDPVVGMGSIDRAAPDSTDLHPEASIPICPDCSRVCSIMGPYGLRRDTARFARYFVQCGSCDGMRPTQRTRWYPLGTTPPLPTSSSRPRNSEQIDSYIVDYLQKRRRVDSGEVPVQTTEG